VNQEVQKLQELLKRVQRNAALPRTLVSAGALEPSAPQHEAHMAASAPAYIAPPSELTAEEMFFESEPPPPLAPAPPYVPAFAPEPPTHVSASLDASVDDLLLEDPFPSVPPAPAPSYNDVLEEDPIPLVAVAPPRPLDHEDDVSGVMSISEFGDEQPEELLEDDIVEMTSTEAELRPVNNGLDELSFGDLDDKRTAPPPNDDEPPASSSRSKIAGTMDEALARAAEQIQLEEGREVPLKTPPPESGPQAAVALPAGMHAPLAPDIEELLEADILPSAGVRAAVPTPEQLGQTIDLEEARGPSLELDQPVAFRPDPLHEDLSNEELEVTLPGREFGGGYQDDLMPPPEARQELDAHRQRVTGDSVPSLSESLAHYPPQQPEAGASGFAPVTAPASVTTESYSESVSTVTVDAPSNAEFAPELLARPDLSPSPVAKFIRAEAPRPKTFMELLDTSLALGSD
jgi:hypothetical protein